MKNPWTKRNPFMSMWLSAANTVAASARKQSDCSWQTSSRNDDD